MISSEFQQYEDDCKRIREENKDLINGFKAWLVAKNLSKRVIEVHVSNIDLYIDHYLLYYDAMSSKGYVDVLGFLNFCESKVYYGNRKSFYASIKKYYAFMYEINLVDKDIIEQVKESKNHFE